MVEGLLRPCVMCHSQSVCVCVSCASQPRDWTFVQRCVQKYHNVHVCSVPYIWPWCAKFCLRGGPVQPREGSCCRGLPKGFMSEGIRPSQLSGGLIFRSRWVRFFSHKSAACIKGRASRLQTETGTIRFRLAGGSDHS